MLSRGFFPSLAVLLLLSGCSGDRKPAPEGTGTAGPASPPVVQPGSAAGEQGALRIEPAEVFRGTPVRISTAASLPAGASVEWLVNGTVAQSGGSQTLDTSSLRKGDRIQARAAGAGGTLFSQEVPVRNSLPEIRWARFVLGEGPGGSGIGVEAEPADADGDTVQLEIAWQKNGEPAGTGNRLGVPLKRGDKIVVTITPFDGEGRGKGATITRDIRNLPPVIEGQEQFQVKENVVTFHVRASDADGDSLAYAVKEAPAGMRIDRATGWVRWETPPGTTGRVPFTVTVSDGSGGESTARFTVTITEQSPAPAR